MRAKEELKPQYYAKWQRTSNKRIQEVGEQEDVSQRQASRRRVVEDAEPVAEAAEAEAPDRGRKPIVPFTGIVEEKYLTNKQKRLMKKRQKSNTVIRDDGRAKNEVKTAEAMIKERRAKEDRRQQANPKTRKVWADKKKAEHREKVQRKIEKKAAYQRSFQIAKDSTGKRKGKGKKK